MYFIIYAYCEKENVRRRNVQKKNNYDVKFYAYANRFEWNDTVLFYVSVQCTCIVRTSWFKQAFIFWSFHILLGVLHMQRKLKQFIIIQLMPTRYDSSVYVSNYFISKQYASFSYYKNLIRINFFRNATKNHAIVLELKVLWVL